MERKPFECPVCPFKRSQKGKVNSHILATKDAVHAPHADTLLTCEICPQEFTTSHARKNHEDKCREKAIQRLESLAARLLALFCSLDSVDIPEIIFCRLRKDRTRWGSNGEIEHVAFPVTNLLPDILTDPDARQFENTVQCLISSKLIESGSGALGKRKFTIKPRVRDHVRGASRNQQELLEWLCLVIICHTFPGRREEVGFGDSARAMMPQVRHVFSHCQHLTNQIVRYPDIGYGITLTLLLSSYVSDRRWKLFALDLVGKILSCGPQVGNGTLYLQKWRAQRARDISVRLPNISIESLCEEQPSIDPRTNALHGEYLRSNAQEILMNKPMTIAGSLDDAYQKSSEFRPFGAVLSEMEDREEYQLEYFRGKVHRWKARFRISIEHFDRLYISKYFTFDENGCNIISHLIGALCEHRELDGAEVVARQAVYLLERVEQEKDLKRVGLMSFRILQLSLAETLICKALFKRLDGAVYNEEVVQKLAEAERVLQSLREGYEMSRRQRGLTWASETNYLRVHMGRALTSYLQGHLEESFDRWEEARRQGEVCRTVVTIFVPMIINYIQCDISRRFGKWGEAEILLERARRTFQVTGREHWWTCYGTLLLDIFMVSIPNSGISRMDVELGG